MKTRDLIALLRDADPSGDIEVCVGNHDILFVAELPAYYDGCLQVLERDPSRYGYNVVGAEFRSQGSKIDLHTFSVEDAICENPDLPVRMGDYEVRNYGGRVLQWREESR